MSFMDFITDNWGMFIILIGFIIALSMDVHLEERMIRRIIVTIVLLVVYTTSCYIESYYGELPYRTVIRGILSALNYGLISFIILNAIFIMFPQNKLWLFFPAVINTLACIISIPTKIVFSFSEDNHFARGPLGYLPYIVNTLYLTYLFYCLFKRRRHQLEEFVMLMYIMATLVICLVMPLFYDGPISGWFYLTISSDLVLYYIYLLQQYTKRDPLTGLLNRQSYNADSDKYQSRIKSIITMDMDGLKELNDSEGHAAGDLALKTLAECFWKAAERNCRIYRIGGDEYAALLVDCSEEQVKEYIRRVKEEVAKTSYSCSVGYAMKDSKTSIEEAYKKADANLYVEKKEYYISSGKNKRR